MYKINETKDGSLKRSIKLEKPLTKTERKKKREDTNYQSGTKQSISIDLVDTK